MNYGTIEAHAIRAALDEAIRVRERDARWYLVAGERYRDLRAENLLLLRELRRVRRVGLRAAAPIVEREDAIAAAKEAALRDGDFYLYAPAS